MTEKSGARVLGRYIVSDPKICHGKPTFRGTRIMVWQVIEMVVQGMAWETIVEECHNSFSKDAIAEAIKLSGEAFLKHANAQDFETGFACSLSIPTVRLTQIIGAFD
jgi:uncharacterized protein (DUF433 family)